MTIPVITFQHKNYTFFVRESQRDELNQALEAKEMPKCEMTAYEYKDGFLGKISTQPEEGKVFVPGNYKSEEFLVLLDQDDPRGFIKGDKGESVDSSQEGTKEEQEETVETKHSEAGTPDTPITKAEKQVAKIKEKLADVKYVPSDKEANLTTEIEKIKTSFESQINNFQDLINKEFLEEAGLLKNLGRDLPVEDIDKIYFVHCEGATVDSKFNDRRKAVVKFLEDVHKNSNEYKLALNFRIAKYKAEISKFIKSYVNAHIRLAIRHNDATINESVDRVRAKIDNSVQYKAEMDKVRQLQADRASEKLEKDRKLEKAKAMKQIAKAGIIAVLENCVKESKKKLNLQFDNAVALTRSQMKRLSEEVEGFDPKSNVEHYKMLVKNVYEMIETNPQFKIEPIGSESDNKTTESEKLAAAIMKETGGNLSPEIKDVFAKVGLPMDGFKSNSSKAAAVLPGANNIVPTEATV